MTNLYDHVLMKNIDHPFTELFALLTRSSAKHSILTYHNNELKILYQHVHNAIDILLPGLQDLVCLVGHPILPKRSEVVDIKNIGFLISIIANLIDALNIFRLDISYTLRQRGEVNY